MEADFDTQTTSPCPCPVSVQCGVVGVVATGISMCVDELAVSIDVFMLDVFDMNSIASQPASKMSHKNWIVYICI